MARRAEDHPGKPDWGSRRRWDWTSVLVIFCAVVTIASVLRLDHVTGQLDAARRDVRGAHAEARGWCRIAELNADLAERPGLLAQHFSLDSGELC